MVCGLFDKDVNTTSYGCLICGFRIFEFNPHATILLLDGLSSQVLYVNFMRLTAKNWNKIKKFSNIRFGKFRSPLNLVEKYMRPCLYRLLWLFTTIFPCVASSTPVTITEFNAFLQLYNSSQEKLEGWGSIAYAIENNYNLMAEFLINKGENFDIYYKIKFKDNENRENIYRKHPFLTAIAQGKIFLVSLMANTDNSPPYYPRMCIDNLEEYWEKYFGSTTIRDIVDRRGALQIAITDCPNSYEMVQTLLNLGAWVNTWNNFQHDPKEKCLLTPLTYAILEKRLDIAKLLLDNGAKINNEHIDKKNQALNQSIRIGFLEGTLLLLEHGARIDKEILWEAILQNDLNALVLLLAYSASSNVNLEMITYASTNCSEGILNALMEVYVK